MFLCYKQLISNRCNTNVTVSMRCSHIIGLERKHHPVPSSPVENFYSLGDSQKGGIRRPLRHTDSIFCHNTLALQTLSIRNEKACGASDGCAQQSFQDDVTFHCLFSTSGMKRTYQRRPFCKSKITTLLQPYLGSPLLRQLNISYHQLFLGINESTLSLPISSHLTCRS